MTKRGRLGKAAQRWAGTERDGARLLGTSGVLPTIVGKPLT